MRNTRISIFTFFSATCAETMAVKAGHDVSTASMFLARRRHNDLINQLNLR